DHLALLLLVDLTPRIGAAVTRLIVEHPLVRLVVLIDVGRLATDAVPPPTRLWRDAGDLLELVEQVEETPLADRLIGDTRLGTPCRPLVGARRPTSLRPATWGHHT